MWSTLEPLANEDETLHDGFCKNGVFKIFGEEKILQSPQIQAIVQDRKMIIAIDKNVFFLENEIEKCCFIDFSTTIDGVATTKSGNIIVCALLDGTICGIHIKSLPVFKLSINNEDIDVNKTFVSVQQIDNSFYLVCSNGSIYKITNVNEECLESINSSFGVNETYACDDTIMENVQLERIVERGKSKKVLSSGFFMSEINKNYNSLLIAGSKNQIKFENQFDEIKIQLPDEYNGLKMILNLEYYILGLSNSGHLFEICPYSKIIFDHFHHAVDYLVDDIVAMENNSESIELLILTKASGNENVFMKIVEFPSFKCKYELEMNQFTWLVNQPKNSVNLYYLSGENCNEDNVPQEIHMKQLTETQPEQRLKKLIQKGHFDEAEEFGKQFDLSLQPIYECKVKRQLIEISSIEESKKELMESKFQQLLQTLKLIENKEFFIENRFIDIPNRKILKEYLNEVLEHLNDDNYDSVILEIKEQQLRLETLNIIDPYECNMELQKLVFHPDILKLCTNLFKTEILTACFIWKRHCASIVPHLDEETIVKILKLIPANTEPFNVIQWLRHFIPSVIQSHPKTLPMSVEWSIQKIRALQYSHYWPEIGLEFASKVTQIFEDIEFMHSDINRQYESSMQKMRSLLNTLEDICVLKTKYNLIFTLENYIKDSITETSLRMLQRVQTDNLKQFVENFLFPIFMEKGKAPTDAIIDYIKFLVTNNFSLTTWIERAVMLIQLLHNEEEKLMCALMVLRASPIPWPKTLDPLLKLSQSSHPLAIEINSVYELQLISIIKKKYNWPINSSDPDMKFIFRMVAVNLPDVFEDIQNFTKANPELRMIANSYYCYELARNNTIEDAIQFFGKLNARQKSECAERITNIVLDVLDESDSINNNLLDLLSMISPYVSPYDQTQIKNFSKVHLLREKFQLKLSMNELYSRSKKFELLQDGVEHFIKNLKPKNHKNLIKFFWNEISQLADTLSLDKLDGILILSSTVGNLHLTCAMAHYALELLDCDNLNKDLFVELAILLISQQIQIFWDESESIRDPLAYPLAYQLLVKSMSFKNIFDINELLKWIRVGNDVYSLDVISKYYDKKDRINELLLEDFNKMNGSSIGNGNSCKRNKNRETISIFDCIISPQDSQKEERHIDPKPVLRCVSFAILSILIKIQPEDEVFPRIFNYLPDNITNSVDEVLNTFMESFEQLVKTKQHNSWFNIAQYILHIQQNSKYKILAQSYLSIQTRKMFRHLLLQKNPNTTDLLAMLFCEPFPGEFLDNLCQDLRNDQQKVNFLILAEIYYTQVGETEIVAKYRDRRLKYYYYMELCKQDENLIKRIDTDTISMTQLKKELKSKQLNIKLIKKLCKDFEWDYQQFLISQIITVLNSQKLMFELKTDSFGKEELLIKITVEEIISICRPYLNEVKKIDVLVAKLSNYIKEINYYFYELYLAVIEILTDMDSLPKDMELFASILIFLKHKLITKRKNRPGQVEIEAWLKFQSEGGVLPKISKYRLPFLPIVEHQLKDILDDEINVDNCESWFPLIKMHCELGNLKSIAQIQSYQDYFCMSAVKKYFSEYSQKNQSDTWYLQPINNAFLQSLLRLVQHVSDKNKVIVILYFVANNSPNGADQVEAAHECYKFAINNEEELMEKSGETVLKIKRKYPIYKTQHLLHIYGLVEDRLLQLVESPRKLIHLLYHHEVILKSTKPDINKLVEEISLLHDLDFAMIQQQLLQKWLSFNLSSDVHDFDGDATFYEDLNDSENNAEECNSEFVVRAHYILSSWDTEIAMNFLIGHIFRSDRIVDTAQQLQMCECFTQLIDDKSSTLSYVDVLRQQNYIIFKCVHNLKLLGYNFNAEKFEKYDKISILKKIWENHVTNSLAMKIIADICLGFNIHIPKIWNGVLQQMVNFNMLKELNALVDTLSCKNELLHTNGLQMAWEFVLRSPFKYANCTRSDEQEEILTKNLFRIQSCPLVSKINLLEIANDCIRLRRPHLAAILLAFSNIKSQKDQIKSLIIPFKSDDLKKDLIELEENGILNNIINYVLKEMEL